MPIAKPDEVTLIVSPDEGFRKGAREHLEMGGFRVLDAMSKADAELICKQYLGPIHLLVIDLDLPDTDGVKLALELQALRPEMRLLGLSAHPQRMGIEPWLRGGAAILEKPVPAKQLAQRVREVMDGRRGEPS